MAGDWILVVDFGGTQAQSTARKLRGEHVYCEIETSETAYERVARDKPKGLLFAGGVTNGMGIDARLLALNMPVLALGACARYLCVAMGGRTLGAQIERATAQITFTDSPLFDGLMESDRFFERVDALELPPECKPIAYSADGAFSAFSNEEKLMYALQFYPETHDPDGLRILSNFARAICGCEPWWSVGAFERDAIAKIREDVGGGSAFIAISGGVDSSVCAALMHKAIGDRLKCIFVDTGLMRQGETELVRDVFANQLGLDIRIIDARERFYAALRGVTSADDKRDIVAHEMMHVMSDEAARVGKIDCLAQGTIYPDVLTAIRLDGGSAADADALMDHIEFTKLIEPLRTLFKDEVRVLGEQLGMPSEMIRRQPFPEAGLAVRIMGEATPDRIEILRRADAIFREEIADAGLDRRVWQYFAVLTGIMTNGMRGGAHLTENTVALRAVSSQDAISAYAYRLPYDLLERVVTRVTGEVPGICRVLYDITGKPPAMIEWE